MPGVYFPHKQATRATSTAASGTRTVSTNDVSNRANANRTNHCFDQKLAPAGCHSCYVFAALLPNEHTHFCRKMCNVHVLKIFRHHDGHDDNF